MKVKSIAKKDKNINNGDGLYINQYGTIVLWLWADSSEEYWGTIVHSDDHDIGDRYTFEEIPENWTPYYGEVTLKCTR